MAQYFLGALPLVYSEVDRSTQYSKSLGFERHCPFGLIPCYAASLCVRGALGYNHMYPLTSLFLFIVLFQLRTATRELHNIPGSCCNDFCCALCCTCCTLTQLVGQLWARPEEVPGCTFSDAAAGMP
jgi:Cys-rich protein (TIGR01571 family)